MLLNRAGRVIEIRMKYDNPDDHNPRIFEARLPEEIGTMTELRHLDLRDQQILSPLPDSFRNLVNIRSLSLRNTLLDEPLPDYFGTFTKLTHIDVVDTDLTYEPGHPFFAMPQLQHVSFEDINLNCGTTTRDNPLFSNLQPCP